jgi:hypothetical protein
MQRTEAPAFRENMPGLQISSRRVFVGRFIGSLVVHAGQLARRTPESFLFRKNEPEFDWTICSVEDIERLQSLLAVRTTVYGPEGERPLAPHYCCDDLLRRIARPG